MFSLLWRFLPGPAWVRILVMLVVLAVIVAVLVLVVYPQLASLLASEETTVQS